MTDRIPVEFWQRHRLVPISAEDDRVTVGIDESTPVEVLEDVRLTLGKDVRPVRMSSEEIDEALRRLVLNSGEPGIEEGDDEGLRLDASSDLMGDAAGAPCGAGWGWVRCLQRWDRSGGVGVDDHRAGEVPGAPQRNDRKRLLAFESGLPRYRYDSN